MAEQEAVIRFENMSYRYPRRKNWVLKDINLEIHKREFVAIMGANGAGKTTLCECINGIIPNSAQGKMKGRVVVNGKDTQETEVAELATQVGIVLEDPETQLFTTVIRNEVAFGPENLKVDPDEIRRRVEWALKVVGLEEYADRQPTALSGGQKQRLAIATALAMGTEIMVLDEPTAQLDPLGTRDVFEVIRELKESLGMTIIIATHKSEEIAEFADKVCVLKEGTVQAYDTPRVIFSDTELLMENWIRPPQVSELASYLAKRGVPFESFPILRAEACQLAKNWCGVSENE